MNTLSLIFTNPTILMAFKVAIISLVGLYTIFSYVVLKQVGLMNKTFQTSYGILFKTIALFHFIAVGFVFVLSFIIL